MYSLTYAALHVHVYMHERTHTRARTHTHTHTHTLTHTHTHTHMPGAGGKEHQGDMYAALKLNYYIPKLNY